MELALEPINFEIAIESEDTPYAISFRDSDKTRVGKIHRNVSILEHQTSDAGEILPFQRGH